MKLNTVSKTLLFTLFGFLFISCQANNTALPIETKGFIPIATGTAIPTQRQLITPSSNSTSTPEPSGIAYCTSENIYAPLTKSQITFLEEANYELIFSSDIHTISNIYPINGTETICSPVYKTQDKVDTVNVAKVISGFIIDINAPDKSIYDPGGKNFVYVYIKVRFVAQNGSDHDYWMKLPGYQPTQKFQVVRWDQPVQTQQAMDIFRKEKSADGNDAYVDARTIILNHLVKVNQQFIAMILAGTANNKVGLNGIGIYGNTVKQLIEALEGKSDFPSAPDGFYLEADALIVPIQP